VKNYVQEPLILFDGVCNLCNSSVHFIIKYDTNSQFKFASLQSDAAKEILLQKKERNNQLNSIILIYNGIFFYKSSAILEICSILGGVFNIAKIFYIIPRVVRDQLYDLIAKRRYRWFGKRKHCLIPTAALKSRFIS
jgi:predicted DCC family thiol-disulfide oxidoreductase YuxK|tara:strand:+ start:888 stop:1298 length:411 start_codon:yes stop_codon:yes gene_type:complete